MKKLITTLSMVLVLAGCSSEDQSATSQSLQKAGEQAKEAVKNAGEAISDTASTAGEAISNTASKAKDKWEEANAGRFDETPNEDPNLPQTTADTEKLKETLSTAKDKVIEKGGEVIDKMKE